MKAFYICIRFNMAEMRRSNQWIMRQDQSNINRNSAADSDIELLSNLISLINST